MYYNYSALIPIITDIVNASLANGDLPSLLKTALIKTILKKLSLDPEILKNIQPISNLLFLSKVIEKVVARILFDYMAKNGFHDVFQSA